MGNCAGIDWASEKHDVLIEDPAGEELLAETFVHDEDGVSALCAALVCFDVEVVAIERPDGLLVDRLLEAGVRVLALHPNQVKAARDRFRASGGKSDQFDRFVLCELARTDRHRFRILEPDLDETKALRALVRAREDLVGARVALANQLRAELERFWPGPIGLFCNLDSPISLAFLARYPSPADTRGLGTKRLAGFLKGQRYNNRKTPAQLLGRLRSAPSGRAGELETRARRSVVQRLVSTLQVMVEQIAELESEITEALDAHPDGEIFSSFFRRRDSVICAATLLAEIGDCRARYPHRDAIAADGGQAPVAKESGKRKHATFRWACNKRLRNALATLAHSSRIWNPWAADRYAEVEAADAGYAFSPDGGRTFPSRGRGIRVPRLEAILARWPDARVNIDPKSDVCVGPLGALPDRLGSWDRVCIGSFSDRRLRRIRALGRGRACTSMGPQAVALARLTTASALMRRLGADCIQVPISRGRIPIVTARFIAAAHRAGLPVHVWTINDETTINKLLDLGVDGIMSDRLRLLRDVLTHRGLGLTDGSAERGASTFL